jgi:hypothetical protein
MRNAKLLIFILAGGTAAIPSLHADAILQLYSERVTVVPHGGTMPLPGGYYNPVDPTLISSSQTVSDPWTHNGHEDQKVSNAANYFSEGAVNRNRVLSYCASGNCASDPYAEGHSNAEASGHADTQNLRVGAYSSAQNYGASVGALATATAEVTTQFRVTSGQSGLADGTVVDLNWLYHLDGVSGISGRTYPDLSHAISSAQSLAKIRRLYSVGEGEDILASVDFRLDLSLADMLPSAGSDDTAYLSGFQSWSAYGNNGFWKNVSQNYSQGFSGEGIDVSRTINVDSRTGMLDLDYLPFQIVVGEWMEIDLKMNLFTSASGSASPFGPIEYGGAYANYFNTLKSTFEFGAASQGLGLQLEFAQAAEASAPEPGTTFIAGLGLTAIGLLLRRRQASR